MDRRKNADPRQAALARQGLLILLLIAAACLAGCDGAEFDRIRDRARVNEQIRLGCVPLGKEKVLIAWKDGQLTCWRYTPGKYGPHIEVERRVVAVAEDVL